MPVVTTRAQFSYGPHLGARPKPAPEFIGATNRAARRRIRVAELDRRIAEVKRQRDELAAELSLVDEALANLELAQRELPRTAPVTEARQKVSEAAAHLSAARSRLDEAKTALDAKVAELDARTRRLRRTAADRDMPVSADEVTAVERAVTEFERAAEELARARGDAADLSEDLKGRRARIDRLSGVTSWKIHDLRRSMRTHLSALPVQDLVRELVIAHAKPGLHRVYDQHAYEDEKRQCLNLWERRLLAILNPPEDAVLILPIRAAEKHPREGALG